ATTRTRDLVRPPKSNVAPLRDKTRRLSMGKTPQIDGRPQIARPRSDSPARATTASIASARAATAAIDPPRSERRSSEALLDKRDAANAASRRPARSLQLPPSTDLGPTPAPRSFDAKRDATDLRRARSGPERSPRDGRRIAPPPPPSRAQRPDPRKSQR